MEGPSLQEELKSEDDAEVDDLYSLTTFNSSQNHHLGVFRLLESCLIHYFLCADVYSHPLRPAGKQSKLSLLKTPVLKGRNGTLAHVEERYALPELNVNFAKKKN